MSNGSTKKRTIPPGSFSTRIARFLSETPLLGLAVILGVVTFLIYAPSLGADFVYDGRVEILNEGFITVPSHIVDVLTLKVLSMKVLLSDRPGELLYLMNIALWSGKNPFGYHVCSNLLHALNVGLVFVLMVRLLLIENQNRLHVRVLAALSTLFFALHPIVVEPVSDISYSNDLLVTLFTLLALFVAMELPGGSPRKSALTGFLIAFCSLAAVLCKEAGLVVPCAVTAYWILFRWRESKGRWLACLATSFFVVIAFLTARFAFALPSSVAPHFLGGSRLEAILTQPRLWAFMIGKLVCPLGLSADYTLQNITPSTPLALLLLSFVLYVQIGLALKSRLAAFGAILYWVSLAPVSNFVPLYRIVADRFYYLPLIGVALQLTVLALLIIKARPAFLAGIIGIYVLIFAPFLWLNFTRQGVFMDEDSLWTDTVQTSPYSSEAHNNLASVLIAQSRREEAEPHLRMAVALNPENPQAYNNLASLCAQSGRSDEAIELFHRVLAFTPDFPEARLNLGNTYAEMGRNDEAIEEFSTAISLKPNYFQAHFNLANTYAKMGQKDKALAEYEKAAEIDPNSPLFAGARAALNAPH